MLPDERKKYLALHKFLLINYLAHAYLSFNHPAVLVGNMISDFVKGKKQFDYPGTIHAGIRLHRMIDQFTDEDIATREAKEIFRPVYRLYCGALVDVVFDHFLAADPDEFSEQSLREFSLQVYEALSHNEQWLPERFAAIFPYMKTHNWLFNYRTTLGAGKSIGGLVHRAQYISDSRAAIDLFEKNYGLLQDCYLRFWSRVKPFARTRMEELLSG